jgi:hypothetical protein
MCKFVINDNSKKKEHFIWHIGRMVDWKYNLHNRNKFFPSNFSKSAQLWFNGFHDLIGFVISEEMNNEFTVFLKDDYSLFYSELVAWAIGEWGQNNDTLVTQVVEGQDEYLVCLLNAGFKKCEEEMEMTRVFDTTTFSDYIVDDPSVIFQSMEENKNYIEQANLRRGSWQNSMDHELDLQIREYTRTSPIYNSKFDFVLVNKENKHVSGCEAFIDYVNNTAEIERVCTSSNFQNKGYAATILKACMRELYKNNIMTAYLSAGYDKTFHLYGKLGHVKEVSKSFYKLDIS